MFVLLVGNFLVGALMGWRRGVRAERRRIAALPPRSLVIGGQAWDVTLSPTAGTRVAPNTAPIGDAPHGRIVAKRVR